MNCIFEPCFFCIFSFLFARLLSRFGPLPSVSFSLSLLLFLFWFVSVSFSRAPFPSRPVPIYFHTNQVFKFLYIANIQLLEIVEIIPVDMAQTTNVRTGISMSAARAIGGTRILFDITVYCTLSSISVDNDPHLPCVQVFQGSIKLAAPPSLWLEVFSFKETNSRKICSSIPPTPNNEHLWQLVERSSRAVLLLQLRKRQAQAYRRVSPGIFRAGKNKKLVDGEEIVGCGDAISSWIR